MENIEENVIGEDAEGSAEIKDISMTDSEDQPDFSEGITEAEEKPKEDAGVILKKVRESKGVSLEIVHDATKIPMDALRAIEEGYTIRMLTPFYYKGFLKMYANYLGMDASEVIEDYKPEELPRHIDPNLDGFEMPPWVEKFFTQERKQQAIIVAGAILALFLLF